MGSFPHRSWPARFPPAAARLANTPDVLFKIHLPRIRGSLLSPAVLVSPDSDSRSFSPRGLIRTPFLSIAFASPGKQPCPSVRFLLIRPFSHSFILPQTPQTSSQPS